MVEIYWGRLHKLELVLELFAETASITGQIVDSHDNDWQWVSLPKMGKRYQIAQNRFRCGNGIVDDIKMITEQIISRQQKAANRPTVASRPFRLLRKILRSP